MLKLERSGAKDLVDFKAAMQSDMELYVKIFCSNASFTAIDRLTSTIDFDSLHSLSVKFVFFSGRSWSRPAVQ